MTPLRLALCGAALSLCSCSLSTAPEPSDFKLSADALSKQYRATRKTGSVRLYANEIQTTRDEWGRETHLASGGSVLVKDTTSPIWVQAPRITITPDFAEAHGKGTVKKADRLYIGQDDSTTIRIDGAAIKPEGPYVIRAIAADKPAEVKAEEPAKLVAEATPSVQEEPQTAEPPPREVVKVKPPTAPKPKAKPRASVAKSTPPAKPNAPADKPAAAPAKPSQVAAKPSSPPPAAKPAAAPAVDRSRLLNLMREPTER